MSHTMACCNPKFSTHFPLFQIGKLMQRQLVLSIKPKAEVIGYPGSHDPEAGKDSHATGGP